MAITLEQKRAIVRLAEPALRVMRFGARIDLKHPGRGGRRPVPVPIPASPEADPNRRRWDPRRVLIVRLDSIGDVLLSEPAIAALRKRFPHATLDLAVSSVGRAVLDANPAVDNFIVYDAPWHAAWRGAKVSWQREALKLGSVLRQLRRHRYDLVVELRGDFRDINFALLTGSRPIVGCGWRGGGKLLDYDVPFDTQIHQVDFALAIARGAGADSTPRPPFLWVDEEDHRRIDSLLKVDKGATLIGVHLSAGFPSKCLPVAKFAAAASGIGEGWDDHWGPPPSFVVVGGRDESPLAAEFGRLLGQDVIDLTGKTSLKGTAAVLARCRLFIGNDSGPMHLAATMGTPVVTFFGPSEPFRFHPYGVPYRLLEVDLDCRPCDFVHCLGGDYQCLSSLEEERIIQAASELLAVPTSNRSVICQ